MESGMRSIAVRKARCGLEEKVGIRPSDTVSISSVFKAER